MLSQLWANLSLSAWLCISRHQMNVLHAILLGVDESEDVIFRSLQHALEHREIRHNAASIEVFGTIEDDLVALGSDLQIAVTWIDGSSDELDPPVRNTIFKDLRSQEFTHQVLLNQDLLHIFRLVLGAHNICSSRPQEMIPKQHTNRPISLRHFADDLVARIPGFAATSVGFRAQDLEKTG